MKSRAVIFYIVLFVLAGSISINGCRKNQSLPNRLNFSIPQGFPQPQYNFSANPLTEEGFQLGKKLFYDGRLSLDGNFACGSCHQPEAAFTTFEHDRSHGYNGAHTLRNAPGLFNLAWYPTFNQDGSAADLAAVYKAHLTNGGEMAETIPNIINKLKNDGDYKARFAAVFGDNKVTEARIYNALSQFVISLVSADAKYDKVKKGQANFTAEEQNGYTVFAAKCATCHTEPLFTDFSFRNNGLPPDAGLNDRGRRRVTGNSADDLKFRVPSLRNAELTSYYAHDGRQSIFRMMIQHYRTGIVQSPTLDPLLTNGISLTNSEENALVAFIRTLTDSAFLNNPRFKK